MRRFFVFASVCAVVFFGIGLLWGVWRHNHQTAELAKSTPLRILCPEKWLDSAGLERFSLEHRVRLDIFTYRQPSDFLRQMANSDGKVDVICTSSFLTRSLIHSHWIKNLDFANLPNMKQIAVDFAHLPFDPDSRYTAPLFWNLYGFFGKGDHPKRATWRQTWQNQRISLWAEELNLLNLMNSLNLNADERIVEEQRSQGIGLAFKKFTRQTVAFLKPEATAFSAEAMIANVDWIQIPLSRVARLVGADSPYHFWLPDEGAAVEVGVLSVGEKSTQTELALQLINEIISPEEAIVTHHQLDTGIVHSSFNGMASIAKMQRPEALRDFPLNQLRFPDLDLQDLPPFQKIFDEIK